MEKIAVDAMGGDFAPLEIVLGSIQAVRRIQDSGCACRGQRTDFNDSEK